MATSSLIFLTPALPSFASSQPDTQRDGETVDEQDQGYQHGGAAKLHGVGHLRNLVGNDVQVHGHGHEWLAGVVRKDFVPTTVGHESEKSGAGEKNRRCLAGSAR